MTILTRFQGNAAIITLNRPERYNATNLEIIYKISQFLAECATNNKVEKIIITSNHPKAFCAGGDIKAAYDAMENNNLSLGSVFFNAEYKLVHELATYPKPIISLVNGLCFGGGMGLSMHNRYRIITENAILGMPETIIGFFPDVGASFRFSQFPKSWAKFYGLTGNNIAISHALKWNMADYFISSSALPELVNALCATNQLDQVIEQFNQPTPNEIIFGENWVDNVFSLDLEHAFTCLKTHMHPEAKKTFNDLNSRSPLSLRVTEKLLETSTSINLSQALRRDYIIAMNFLITSDFKEGIRAQVVDKDKNPKWHYTFDNTSSEMIDRFFQPNHCPELVNNRN